MSAAISVPDRSSGDPAPGWRRRIVLLRVPNSLDDVIVEMPGAAPVDAWLDDLLRALDLPGGGFRLLRPDGGLIPGTFTLNQSGIRNSDRLTLIRADEVSPDMAAAAEALAAAVQPEVGPEPPCAPEPALRPAAPVLLHPDGTEIAIDPLPAVIGRLGRNSMPDVDLSRWDPGKLVSRRHAVIAAGGDGFRLRPEKTTNGTFLNGREMPPGIDQPLSDGDRIQFGCRGAEWIFRLRRC